MPDKAFIYVLKDPETKISFYVGRTNNPDNRLQSHIEFSRKQRSPVEKWIHSLILNNQKPAIEILEICHQHSCEEREDYWIDRLSTDNQLLNRARISEKSSGRRTYEKESQIVSVEEAAVLRGVTRQTISKWMRNGLPYRKQYTVKFIARTDLLAFKPGKVGRKPKETE